MATNTPVYQLRKPADSDDVDVDLDLGDNWDKVEAGLLALVAADTAMDSRVDALEIVTNGIIFKNADESVTSSTTMQNDDHFSLAVTSGKAYIIDIMLGVDGSSFANDIKVGFTFPTGDYMMWGIGPHNTDLASGTQAEGEWIVRSGTATTVTASTPFGTGTSPVGVKVKLVYNCTTSGTLNFQWAQNASSGTAVTVKKNSVMEWKMT